MANKNIYERHEDRLQTTDEHGARVYVHPEDLKGPWKTKRNLVYWGLFLLYLVLPWIHIGGQQSILLDITSRKFYFFGFTFWGHDAPLVIFLFLGFAFLMAFVTALWGRVWCGWLCPQTVLTDIVFRKIETLVEGKSRARMKLDAAPWSVKKLTIKTIKWTLFTIVSLHITHSFLGYFVGTYELFEITTQNPSKHWGLFITMLFINAIVMFDFGWFREQFCIIMCPYGRFQSVMMDANSTVVAYDEKRGEPRKGPNTPKDQQGDCVNCYQCVKVCPTGIDIRRGVQMECIACTACIDACDAIMLRLKKDTGLISYTTENKLDNKPGKKFGVRTVFYGAVIVALFAVATFTLYQSRTLRTVLLRGGRTPFTVAENGLVVNRYKADFYYHGKKAKPIYFIIEQEYRNKIKLTTPQTPFSIKAGRKRSTHLFFKFDKQLLKKGSLKVDLHFSETDKIKDSFQKREVILVGPY